MYKYNKDINIDIVKNYIESYLLEDNVYKAEFIKKDKKNIYVCVGFKGLHKIDINESNIISDYDNIYVYVKHIDNMIEDNASIKIADTCRSYKLANTYYINMTLLNAVVTEKHKNYYSLKIEHINVPIMLVYDAELNIGSTVSVYITSINKSYNMITACKTLNMRSVNTNLQIGDVVQCLVKSCTKYGIYVKVKNTNEHGLIYNNDITWTKNYKHNYVIFSELSAIVLSIGKNIIRFGIKQLENDPLHNFKVSDVVLVKFYRKSDSYYYGYIKYNNQYIIDCVLPVCYISYDDNYDTLLSNEISCIVHEININDREIIVIRENNIYDLLLFLADNINNNIELEIVSVLDFGVLLSYKSVLTTILYLDDICAINSMSCFNNIKNCQSVNCILLSVDIKKAKICVSSKIKDLELCNSVLSNGEIYISSYIDCRVIYIDKIGGAYIELFNIDMTVCYVPKSRIDIILTDGECYKVFLHSINKTLNKFILVFRGCYEKVSLGSMISNTLRSKSL